MLKMRVCIGLPTKNEADNIGIMIRQLRKSYPKADIVIFDEHSTDGTLDVAKRLKIPVVQRKFSGYGAGVLSAIEYSYRHKYDVLSLLDCDQTYPPDELRRLLKFFPEYDFVSGVRDLRMIYPKLHRLPNMFHTSFANLLFGSDIRDINSGMWALKPEKFHGLVCALDFTFTVQLYLRAIKNKYKMKYVGINYSKRVGKSHIKVKDGFKIVARIISERFKP